MPLICLVGDIQDLAIAYVTWIAGQKGLDVLPLPEERFGVDWSFHFSDHDAHRGEIAVQDTRHPFSSIGGAYVRFHCDPPLPQELQLSPVHRHAYITERRAALHQLLHALPCVVANLPSAGRSNASKPFQMRLLEQQGFEVPRWVCSNDQAAVDAFLESCPNGAIYKAASGLRSRVRRVDSELHRRIADGTTPAVVQEYIPGRDVRVHVVADRIFPTEVRGEGVDYRWEHEGTQYRATDLPDPLATLCRATARLERLVIAGFDFRVTDQSHWYCLEMNPVPSFLPYEAATGQPIGAALVDAILNGLLT